MNQISVQAGIGRPRKRHVTLRAFTGAGSTSRDELTKGNVVSLEHGKQHVEARPASRDLVGGQRLHPQLACRDRDTEDRADQHKHRIDPAAAAARRVQATEQKQQAPSQMNAMRWRMHRGHGIRCQLLLGVKRKAKQGDADQEADQER